MSIQTPRPVSATFPRDRSCAEAADSAHATRVDVLTSVSAIEGIADEWRVLEALASNATGFQSYAWCRAWMQANANAAAGGWRIVTVCEAGALVAIWPLQFDRFIGVRVLRWLGEPWTQYGDALLAPTASADALNAAWNTIRSWRDADLIRLGHVRADASISPLLRSAHLNTGLAEAAIHVDLTCPSTGSFPPDRRLVKRRRRLDGVGPVQFEIVTGSAARVACVEEAIALKRAWLEARGRPSTGLGHAAGHALLTDLAESGAMVVGRLTVGGETAALELGLMTNGAFRSLLGAHDPRFSQGSPGHILIGFMIDWLRAAGGRTYDLMTPPDPYKRQWARSEIAVVDYSVTTSARGIALAAYYRLRPALKHLNQRLPPRLKHLSAMAVRTIQGRRK